MHTYHQEDRTSPNEITLEAFLDDPFRSVDIKSRQDLNPASQYYSDNISVITYIIKKKDLCRRIYSTSKRNSCLLSATKRRELSSHVQADNTEEIYLNVRPFSPTSVLSPASNNVKSRVSPHWSMTLAYLSSS